MSKLRKQRKAQNRLDSRLKWWDSLPAKAKESYHRPGSLNPRKGSALHSTHK